MLGATAAVVADAAAGAVVAASSSRPWALLGLVLVWLLVLEKQPQPAAMGRLQRQPAELLRWCDRDDDGA